MSASPTVMRTLLVKYHTLFLPELSEGQLVCNGMPATSSAAPGRRKVAVMSWIQCARASLSKESGQDLRESLEA